MIKKFPGLTFTYPYKVLKHSEYLKITYIYKVVYSNNLHFGYSFIKYDIAIYQIS